jgi:hypothetical protein
MVKHYTKTAFIRRLQPTNIHFKLTEPPMNVIPINLIHHIDEYNNIFVSYVEPTNILGWRAGAWIWQVAPYIHQLTDDYIGPEPCPAPNTWPIIFIG